MTRSHGALTVLTSFFHLDVICYFLCLLPLHSIPLIGSIVSRLHSTFMAWGLYLYYYDHKGRWISLQYSSFGYQMLLLQMITLVGSLFTFSSMCSAPLLDEA
ncbi:hypothetical protein DD238_007871 [Peronospora effusa]|uniref:Uncharacterized protein n=1 Tax=Peronospora effusa TaxID=542832 RepID=A0A3M6VBG4_9STRA|nr:hypothetical protein DD238_007871 [Peronospora effusa]